VLLQVEAPQFSIEEVALRIGLALFLVAANGFFRRQSQVMVVCRYQLLKLP
jgi:hypothetical protein